MTDQPKRLSAERLAEIRARANNATGGLWVIVYDGTERSISTTESGRFVCHLNSNMLRYQDDADFIASARADIPALIEHINALEAEHAEILTAGHAMAREIREHAPCSSWGIDRAADQWRTLVGEGPVR